MSRPARLRDRLGLPATIAALALLGGCGSPSEETRQNRRLVDGLLTAVTMKNRNELEKGSKLLDGRKSEGHLSAAYHQELQPILGRARSGKWAEAEEALYRLREAQPFPK